MTSVIDRSRLDVALPDSRSPCNCAQTPEGHVALAALPLRQKRSHFPLFGKPLGGVLDTPLDSVR
jgi:hypothetical protein